MEVKFYRGATVGFSDGNRKLICDPWLVDGIYYGSWAHYPAYTEDDWKAERPDDMDYIYISHIHPDHFDPNTLRRLNPKAKVLIHSFVQKFLKAKIDALGFETIELENGGEFDMGHGFKIRVFAADDCDPTKCGAFFKCVPGKSTQIDSLAVISTPTTTAVNVNDAPWGLGHQLARRLGDEYHVDMACLAHGLAGAFPQCFRGTPEWVQGFAEARAVQSLSIMLKWMVALRTRMVLPFAAGYVLAGKLSHLNRYRGIPSVDWACKEIEAVGATPIGNTVEDLPAMQAYVESVLSKRKLDYEDDPFPTQQELEDLLDPAFARFDRHRQEMGFKAKNTVNFKVGEQWLSVPPEGNAKLGKPHREKPYCDIEADPRLLKKLLMGPKHAHWNNAEIGSHLTFDLQGPRELGLSLLMSYFHA